MRGSAKRGGQRPLDRDKERRRNKLSRTLQTLAAVFGLAGYLVLPSCDRRSSLFTDSFSDISTQYTIGGLLLGGAVVLLLAAMLIPSNRKL